MMSRIALAFVVLIGLSACGAYSQYIHGAAGTNDLERVKTYVAEGHVNDREERFNHTPLMIACYYGYKEIAEYLCQNGADLDAQGIKGSTALILAASYNRTDITKILLDSGAAVNIRDKAGNTALYYALIYRYHGVSKVLRAHGGLE